VGVTTVKMRGEGDHRRIRRMTHGQGEEKEKKRFPLKKLKKIEDTKIECYSDGRTSNNKPTPA